MCTHQRRAAAGLLVVLVLSSNLAGCRSGGAEVAENEELDEIRGPSPRALHRAAKGLHVEEVLSSIAAGVDLEARGAGGETALLAAVGSDAGTSEAKLACLRALLEAGADANGTNDSGLTPLLEAARSAPEDVAPLAVRLLIEHGADPYLADHSGCDALCMAAQRDDAALLGAMLDLGVTPERSHDRGTKAVELALAARRIPAFARLVDAGTSVPPLIEVMGSVSDFDVEEQRYVLELALDRNADPEGAVEEVIGAHRPDQVQLLMECGIPDVPVRRLVEKLVAASGDEADVWRAVLDDALYREMDISGAAEPAVQALRIDLTRMLLEEGASPHAFDLVLAELWRLLPNVDPADVAEMIDLLSTYGADVELSAQGEPALGLAVRLAAWNDVYVDAAHALLALGADPRFCSAHGVPLSEHLRDPARVVSYADTEAECVQQINRLEVVAADLIQYGADASSALSAFEPLSESHEDDAEVNFTLNAEGWSGLVSYLNGFAVDCDEVHYASWRPDMRGRAAISRGDLDQAVDFFREAVELASDGSHEEDRVLALFHVAQVSVLRKDLESATEYTQQVLEGAEWESSTDAAGMADRLQGWARSWNDTIARAAFEEDVDGEALAEDFAAVVIPLLRRAVELREELGDAAALEAAQRQLAAAGRIEESKILIEELQDLSDVFR